MSAMTPTRRLLRASLAASLLTLATTGGLITGGGATRAVTDRALAALLLATVPLAVVLAIWGAEKTTDPWLAFGRNRRQSRLGRFAPFLWGLPLLSALLAALVLVWTRGLTDARLLGDLIATLPIAVMATLATLLAFLATQEWFGRIGLFVLLALCLTLGQSELPVAVALPGGHVRHLLGVGTTLPFDPGWSMAALWGFALFGFGAWMGRVPP